jgi:hypothetical protein
LSLVFWTERFIAQIKFVAMDCRKSAMRRLPDGGEDIDDSGVSRHKAQLAS